MNKIDQYILEHSTVEDKVLAQLYRETFVKVLMPRMISGSVQGRILQMFSQMIQPNRILEIGTFTGYSTICLARGLKENGILETIDINDEIAYIPEKYLKISGLHKKVKLLHGNSLKIIPTLHHTYDLIFLDGDKRQYLQDYQLALEKLNTGGFLIADNVLWYEKVVDEPAENDYYTKGIIEFNNFVTADKRVEQVILPIRDGLMMIRKK